MANEHAGCCCKHDDQHDNHDHHDKDADTIDVPTVIEAAGCCAGTTKDEKKSRSNDHAGHVAAGRRSS